MTSAPTAAAGPKVNGLQSGVEETKAKELTMWPRLEVANPKPSAKASSKAKRERVGGQASKKKKTPLSPSAGEPPAMVGATVSAAKRDRPGAEDDVSTDKSLGEQPRQRRASATGEDAVSPMVARPPDAVADTSADVADPRAFHFIGASGGVSQQEV